MKDEFIYLPNGCHRTKLKVKPENWHTKKASLKKDWYIWYRFHSPEHVNDYPDGMLRIVKGMNGKKDLVKRQEATRYLIAIQERMLDVSGFNPITGKITDRIPEASIEMDESGVDSTEKFSTALEKALKSKIAAKSTKIDIRNKIPHIIAAAIKLNIESMPIGSIRRKHVRALLNQLGKDRKSSWTNNQFNCYRRDLSILFEELNELEAMDVNPVHGIKKRKVIVAPREVPTIEERREIDKFLRANYYTFWRFLHLFFHSSSRETEMMALQLAHVDLKSQRFKVLVHKDNVSKWVSKPIKDIVLPLWTEVITEAQSHCTDNQAESIYLFHEGLKPGVSHRPIRASQISRRWKSHVKDKLKVSADFYSLKHLNNTEMMDVLSSKSNVSKAEQQVARSNGHTNTNMVAKVYDIHNKQRKDNEVKKVGNSFA